MNTYKSSGKWSPGLLLFLVIGLVVAGALGGVYQLITEINPLIYFNFILALVVSFIIGIVATQVVKLGKCRNAVLGSIVGIVMGISAIGVNPTFPIRA